MFRIMLTLFGWLLMAGAVCSQRFRNQITRPRVVELRCEGGPARHYIFDNRRVRSVGGRAATPDVAVVFNSAGQGLRVMLSTQRVSRLMQCVLAGTVKIEGNIMLLLWFQGLAQMVLPITRSPRLAATPPNAYVSHTAGASVSARITREPVADRLDPEWTSAARARAEVMMIRVNSGEPPPVF